MPHILLRYYSILRRGFQIKSAGTVSSNELQLFPPSLGNAREEGMDQQHSLPWAGIRQRT